MKKQNLKIKRFTRTNTRIGTFQEKVLRRGMFVTSTMIRKKLALIDFFIAVTSTCSIVLQYKQHDDYYREIVSYDSIYPYQSILTNRNESFLCSIYRILSGVCSLISGILIIIRYKYHHDLSKILGGIAYKESCFRLRKSLIILFLEVTSHCVFIPPHLNALVSTTQHDWPLPLSLDMLFTILMLPRMTYIIRAYFSFFNYFYNKDKGFQHVLKKYPINPPTFLARAHFKFYPYTSLSLFFTILVVNIGLSLRIPERAFVYFSEKDWEDVANNFWMVVVVITSVGYGDFFPSTHLGRVFTGFAAILGTFFISMMVLMMSNNITFNKLEKRAYSKIKESEVLEEYKKQAARLIYKSIRLNWFLSHEGGQIKTLIENSYKSKNSDQKYRYSFVSFSPENSLSKKARQIRRNQGSEPSIIFLDSEAKFSTVNDGNIQLNQISDSNNNERLSTLEIGSMNNINNFQKNPNRASKGKNQRSGSRINIKKNSRIKENKNRKKVVPLNNKLGSDTEEGNEPKKNLSDTSNNIIETPCIKNSTELNNSISLNSEDKRVETNQHTAPESRINTSAEPKTTIIQSSEQDQYQTSNSNNIILLGPSQKEAKSSLRTETKKNSKIESSNTLSVEPRKSVAEEPRISISTEPSKNIAAAPRKSIAVEPRKSIAVEPRKSIAMPRKSIAVEARKSIVMEPRKSIVIDPGKTAAVEPTKGIQNGPKKSLLLDPTKSIASQQRKSIIMEPRKSVALEYMATMAPNSKSVNDDKDGKQDDEMMIGPDAENNNNNSNMFLEPNPSLDDKNVQRIGRKSIVFDKTRTNSYIGNEKLSVSNSISEGKKSSFLNLILGRSTKEEDCSSNGGMNNFEALALGQLEKNDQKLAGYYIDVKYQIEICKRARAAVIGLKYDVNIELLLDRQKKKVEELMDSLKKNVEISDRINNKFLGVENRLDVIENTLKSMILKQKLLIKRIKTSLGEHNDRPSVKIFEEVDTEMNAVESPENGFGFFLSSVSSEVGNLQLKRKSDNLSANIHKIVVHEEKSDEDSSGDERDTKQSAISPNIKDRENYNFHPKAPLKMDW